MQAQAAPSAKSHSVDERQARLAALVRLGEVTVEEAALIDFREPSAAVQARAGRLSLELNSRGEQLSRASSR